MSSNGTGFWVVVVLIAALSMAAMVETMARLILRAAANSREAIVKRTAGIKLPVFGSSRW